MNDTILVAIIGSFAGLVPPLITAIYTRTEKKGISTAKKKATEQARARVDFLNAWIETKRLVCSSEVLAQTKNRIDDELEQLYSNLSRKLIQLDSAEGEGELNILKKIFLLYRPPSAPVGVLHILFYMLLGLLSFSLISLIGDPEYFRGIDTETGLFDPAILVGELIGGMLVLLLPWATLWWVARKLDKKKRRRDIETQASEPAQEIQKAPIV